ncbi:MAG: hypothetical protein BZ138_06160, partial [Methanosphaera sp. rholeuAM270]
MSTDNSTNTSAQSPNTSATPTTNSSTRPVPSRPASPRPGGRQNRRPPKPEFKPWREHRDDFITCDDAESPDTFEAQAKLLDGLVTPLLGKQLVTRDQSTSRYGSGKLAEYLGEAMTAAARCRHNEEDKTERHYIRIDYKEMPWREVCVFDLKAEHERPVFSGVESFSDVPFQGRGKWGVVIVPSSVTLEAMRLVASKVALGRFLGYIDEDVVAVAVVKASKFDLKGGKAALDEANIPVLFELSGRLLPDKQIVDPAESIIVKRENRRGYGYYRASAEFNGKLTPRQVTCMGKQIESRNIEELLRGMSEILSSRTFGTPDEIELVDTLTFHHENLPKQEEDTAPNGIRRLRHNDPWMMSYAYFGPETMPEADAGPFKKRLEDVAKIWKQTMDAYNVSLIIATPYEQRKKGGKLDWSKTEELGEILGIKEKVDAYYLGVPA